MALPAPPRKKGEPQGRTLRDHLWLEMAAWLRDEAPVFACAKALAEDLAGELAARITQGSRGQSTERSPSPDLADAVGLTLYTPLTPKRAGVW